MIAIHRSVSRSARACAAAPRDRNRRRSEIYGENLIKPEVRVCRNLHLKHQLFDVISALWRP